MVLCTPSKGLMHRLIANLTQSEDLHCVIEGNAQGEPLVELVPPPDCETAVLNTSSIVAVHGLNPTNRKNHDFQTWESSVGGHL